MAKLFGFNSFSQVFVYVVAVFCGISMLMPINAIFSAPAYILFFYRYVQKNPNAVPRYYNFWNNVLAYYNLVSLVTSLVVQPLTLTKLFSRTNVQLRMLCGLIVLVIEIALFLIVPAIGSSEVGALVTICVGGCISGCGKSVFEATVYGMFGAFPPRYLAAVMGGAGISGALTSTLQMIVRGALQNGYQDVRTQSKIYYGLSVGIQSTTFICLILFRWNSFAQKYVSCFRKNDQYFDDNVEADYQTHHEQYDLRRLSDSPNQDQSTSTNNNNSNNSNGNHQVTIRDRQHRNIHDATVQGHPSLDGDHHHRQIVDGANNHNNVDGSNEQTSHTLHHDDTAVLDAIYKSNNLNNEDAVCALPQLSQTGMDKTHLDSHALARVNKLHVFLAIWPLIVSCAFDFLLTLVLFPTVVVSVDTTDYWYSTVVVFIFNVFDMIGRFSPSLETLRPKKFSHRWIILGGSLARLIFLPLLLLASYHYIPSHAFNYVMMIVFGYTNGYVGAVSMVLAPLTPNLKSDAERFVSGTMMGISILVGGAIGTALSIMTQTLRGF